jgi:protein-tyrosine phosphatase
MKRIIFICTGNTCRSPMAMAFFNGFACLEPPEFDYEASSAGLAVSKNAASSENAVLAMKDPWSIDISSHRPHLLSEEEVAEATLLLTMTLSHKHYILSMFPGAYQKVYTLKEYAYGKPGSMENENIASVTADIADPYGSSLWAYKLCAVEIGQAVEKLVEKLKNS